MDDFIWTLMQHLAAPTPDCKEFRGVALVRWPVRDSESQLEVDRGQQVRRIPPYTPLLRTADSPVGREVAN